jgi:homoserine acetyltransferase
LVGRADRAGKAVDTDRLFVVSSNMLGTSFRSSNGVSINPRTGKPCGSAGYPKPLMGERR